MINIYIHTSIDDETLAAAFAVIYPECAEEMAEDITLKDLLNEAGSFLVDIGVSELVDPENPELIEKIRAVFKERFNF